MLAILGGMADKAKNKRKDATSNAPERRTTGPETLTTDIDPRVGEDLQACSTADSPRPGASCGKP